MTIVALTEARITYGAIHQGPGPVEITVILTQMMEIMFNLVIRGRPQVV